MAASDVKRFILSLPGIGDRYSRVIDGALSSIMKQTLIRYPWKFNMSTGTESTTSGTRTYTLKGGTDGDAEDLGVIEHIYYGTFRNLLSELDPRRFDSDRQGSANDSGTPEAFTIRTVDDSGFPIIELSGNPSTGESLTYYYRRSPGSLVSEKFPSEFDAVWQNYLLYMFDGDVARKQTYYREYRDALRDMKQVYIDMTANRPEGIKYPDRLKEVSNWRKKLYSL